MRVAAVLLLAASTFAWAQAPAAKTTAQSVAQSGRKRVEASDFRATGRLANVSPDGQRRNFGFTIRAHGFQDATRIFFEVTSPAEAKLRVLLTLKTDGTATIQTGKPGAKIATLPAEHWGDPVLGSNFSYEDLMEAQFYWHSQALLPEAKYGARDCLVLQSTPAAGEHSHYAVVTTWLDKKVGAPVHAEKVATARAGAKEFIYYDLRQTAGGWAATQIEVKTAPGAQSSLMVLERGSARAKLTKADFDPQLLVRP